MGRETRKRAEVPLTEQQRLQLSIARETVAELSEREPAPEALTELAYEQRQARARALELATQSGYASTVTLQWARKYYDWIWKGEGPDAAV